MRQGLQRVWRIVLHRVYRPLWPLLVGAFARSQLEVVPDAELPAGAGHAHRWSSYSCPLLNPPAQRHVFANKLHNLALAISGMQGLVLQPGEVFSFWRMVGEPSTGRGFREAAILVNRRLVTSAGGGLCQLSGLLYNLALLAGCRILERHPHSVDAYGEGRYIPLGRDATVDYPYKDLCFQNPHRVPLVLVVDLSPERTQGALYGPVEWDGEVEIAVSVPQVLPSPVRRVLDPGWPAGRQETEPGLDGKRVTAWRITRFGNRRVRKELLSHDIYAATPTRVRVGAGSSTS